MLQHFHSMETFSHFEIFNYAGKRVVEGHKVTPEFTILLMNMLILMQASFCLEDNQCQGTDPHYDCANYGDQVRKCNIKKGLKDESFIPWGRVWMRPLRIE